MLLVFIQVSFQATIGRHYLRGIAVDDVTLTNGLCEDESEPKNNEQGILILFLALILWRCCYRMVNVLAIDQVPIQGGLEVLLVASYY